jgi:hypothetical protein
MHSMYQSKSSVNFLISGFSLLSNSLTRYVHVAPLIHSRAWIVESYQMAGFVSPDFDILMTLRSRPSELWPMVTTCIFNTHDLSVLPCSLTVSIFNHSIAV